MPLFGEEGIKGLDFQWLWGYGVWEWGVRLCLSEMLVCWETLDTADRLGYSFSTKQTTVWLQPLGGLRDQ